MWTTFREEPHFITNSYHSTYVITAIGRIEEKTPEEKDLSSKFMREKFRDKNIKSFHLKNMKNINNAKKKRRK